MKSIKMSTKIIILFIIVGVIFIIYLLIGRDDDMRMIAGCKYEYKYYRRELTVDDFRQFGYETTYQEVVDALGEENGDIGSNYFRPYYELNDGTYAIFSFYSMADGIKKIEIADKKEILYALLPYVIPHKEDEEKEEELFYAKQYEMNIVLELLEIKKWEKPQTFEESDNPMGSYSEKELKKYTNENWYIEIEYWFDDYNNLNWEPLYQSIKIYQNDKQCITWNGCLLLECESFPVEEIR